MKSVAVLSAGVIGVCLPLLAQAKPARSSSKSTDVQHQTSITLSPIHLVFPVVELMGEFRMKDRMSAAAIVGVGTIGDIRVAELGAQFRYYVLGSFIHGMNVGAEASYLHARAEGEDTVAEGAGLSVGPFVGYKIATNVGFTFDAQLGAQFMAVQASANSGSSTASASESDVRPLLNLNVGWSF